MINETAFCVIIFILKIRFYSHFEKKYFYIHHTIPKISKKIIKKAYQFKKIDRLFCVFTGLHFSKKDYLLRKYFW